MRDHYIPEGPQCPSCHQRLDGALNTSGGNRPRGGDPTICGYCAEVCVFVELQPENGGPPLRGGRDGKGGGAELGLRSATSEELAELNRDEWFVLARGAVLTLIGLRLEQEGEPG